ncbi:MAG: hypothetical protein SPG03_07415, partial [Veillonella caviae]|uniref:hypothetical protein n=1 Tax=Veillonella caviae TaxID=248316 RepID=UPI002A919900
SDSASSTTRSAISENIILDVENKSVADINRDTEHALNSIKPIFDKDDVKERLAYVNAVSAEGFKLIGDISMAQAKRYEEKAANANTDTLRERYLKEADKWKDGGIYKVALHGGFGAAISNMAGGSSLQGFTAASANELMVGAISKELAKPPHSTIDEQGRYINNSDVYKLASAVLGGAIINSSLGTGLTTSATENNYLTHKQVLQYKNELSIATTEAEKEAVRSKWKRIDEEQANYYNLLSIAIPQLGLEQAYLKGSKAESTLIQQAPELKKVWKSSALRKEMNNAIKEIKT